MGAVGQLVRLAAALFVLGLASEARADDDDPVEYSEFEKELIAEAVEERNASLDPNPEGKWIEDIDIITGEVFDERDPIPSWVNSLHVTTKPRIVHRELLLRKGQRWQQRYINESARNLRALPQLSVVLIVPMTGSRDDRVRMLVIVKDVWSLRLAWDARYADGTLEELVLQPSETNLGGTHRRLSGLFTLELDAYALGASWVNPRIANSRVQAGASANIIINRDSGNPEGSFGSLIYGQPLYSTIAEWAWVTRIAWRREVTRRFVGGELDTYVTSDGSQIPHEFRSDLLVGDYTVTRSYGRLDKTDISVGGEVRRRAYREAAGADRFSDAAVAEFLSDEAPVSDTRLSPFVALNLHSTRFLRVVNFETLSLQEDYQLGHDFLVKVYPASRDVGSSRDLLGLHAALGYTFPVGNGVFRNVVEHTYEFAQEDERDALLQLATRLVTPRQRIGRFVFDGRLSIRYENYLNEIFIQGGHSRPRGYPSFVFDGTDAVAGSAEWRSGSIEMLGAHFGAVLFYDAAHAADGFENLAPKQSVGFGARVLFPQFDRVAMRFDWGFPVGDTGGYATVPGGFIITFEQAFAMPFVGQKGVFDGTQATF